ncbi:hypothetical protein [Micromonospora cremea]|uniref:Uncharacterized protein n=1 Tax=Micromonospora cremea TaxID=709881 RepID=A0A1N6AGF8_9ACTN|nr:hypothetical protein [Micromonospora cremea]SIN33126.1 hypothetical protein SAMN04489832_5490 [Micromonospora cremea]
MDFETVRREFAAQVPAGSRIRFIPARADKVLWQQRLAEFAALAGSVVVTGPTRDYEVGVVAVKRISPTGPSVRLVVRKVG